MFLLRNEDVYARNDSMSSQGKMKSTSDIALTSSRQSTDMYVGIKQLSDLHRAIRLQVLRGVYWTYCHKRFTVMIKSGVYLNCSEVKLNRSGVYPFHPEDILHISVETKTEFGPTTDTLD